jgi:hypothetical protein
VPLLGMPRPGRKKLGPQISDQWQTGRTQGFYCRLDQSLVHSLGAAREPGRRERGGVELGDTRRLSPPGPPPPRVYVGAPSRCPRRSIRTKLADLVERD